MREESEFEPPCAVSYDSDALIVADPQAARLLRSTWSPSGMNAIKSCPARWAIDKMLPRVEDPFGAAELGTSGHRVMELMYHQPSDQRTPADARKIIETLHLDDGVCPPNEADLDEWREAVWSKMAGLFGLEDTSKVQVVHTEEDLKSHVNGVPFRGFVDRKTLVLDDNGGVRGVRVEDYKTGSRKAGAKGDTYAVQKWGDSHGDQGLLYLLALKNRDGRAPDEVSIIYTSLKDPGIYNVPITDARLTQVADEFKETWDIHVESARTGRYEFKSSGLCGWCPLVAVCPAAKAAKKVAKIDMADAAELLKITPAKPRRKNSVLDPVATAGTNTETAPETLGESSPRHTENTETRESGQNTRRKTVNAPIYSNRDAKPWEGEIKGDKLIGESATATAVFGLTGWAMELLVDAKMPITKSGIEGTAHLLASVVEEAMLATSGTKDMQAGFHVRLRGLLHSVLVVEAIPFGQGEQSVIDWRDRAIKRLVAAVTIGAHLWDAGVDDAKWRALGGLGSQASKAA